MNSRNFLSTAFVWLVATSCTDQVDVSPTQKSSAAVEATSLKKEPQLEHVLDLAGFTQAIRGASARVNGEGAGIDVDRILKIVQEDSVHHTYTFKIQDDEPSSFSNLVIEETSRASSLAFILTYEFEGVFTDMNHFSGKVSRFDLEGNLLRELDFLDGVLVPETNDTHAKATTASDCLTGVDKREECLEWRKSNALGDQETCANKVLILTMKYGDCSSYDPDTPSDGTNNQPYGGGTTISSPGTSSSSPSPADNVDGSNPVKPIPGYKPKKSVVVIPDKGIADTVDDLIKKDPFALLDVDCNQLPKWQDLAQHRPPQAVINKLNDLKEHNEGPLGDWDIQYLDNAEGAVVNMDYWPVTVTQMPRKPDGTRYTPREFLQFFRKNINDFIDAERFKPYSSLGLEQQETALWNSSNPVGSIVDIDINPNDGVVVCSASADQYWRFMTLEAPLEWSHPVSGTREFGYEQNPDGSYTFYTRGVDRFNSGTQELISAVSEYYGNNYSTDPFAPADQFWKNLQDGLIREVKERGGVANTQNIVKDRVNYAKVKDILSGKRPISDLGCK